MKNITSIFILLLWVLLYSCNLTQTKTDDSSVIIGKWMLTETLADIGDGKGQWTLVPPNDSTIIQFNKNGTIESREPNYKTVKSYQIVDSANLRLSFKNNQPKINYRFKVQNKILELNPPCIEACGFRYVKIEE